MTPKTNEELEREIAYLVAGIRVSFEEAFPATVNNWKEQGAQAEREFMSNLLEKMESEEVIFKTKAKERLDTTAVAISVEVLKTIHYVYEKLVERK